MFLIILEEQGLSVSSEEVSRIAEEVIEDAYEKDGLLQTIFPWDWMLRQMKTRVNELQIALASSGSASRQWYIWKRYFGSITKEKLPIMNTAS